ncbi:Wzz/FepE/Etk N-terminal domain-containing protein [Sediminibacterium goheungense]|uniref:Chain length determinant protein n=1 Tax=Sediminibacterium goheungense TaxID=1086393 RepID=A0A4R6IXG5_9BACT|nr:Wzz/FepE/Etk N-terminal domain-containing protein [Sediminibacterium goheungense]TDO26575.1 Chain length determinant protein [Sediminibacterium goheungense]
MHTSSFNMAETAGVIQHNWKKIGLFTLLSIAIATVTVYILPKQYRSTAMLIAANPQLADKSRLFNENIQGLYSYIGSGDDLDRIMGIADLDTAYKQLVDEYKLVDYYELSNNPLPLLRRKAVLKLREDLTLQRTERGQLKILCWTKNPQLSADLINAMIKIVTRQAEQIAHEQYEGSQSLLEKTIRNKEEEYRQLADSLQKIPQQQYDSYELLQLSAKSVLKELQEYRTLYAQFTMMAKLQTPVLFVLDKAVPAAKAERPDKPAIIIAAAIAGFVFSILLLLVGNRKRSL